MLAVPQAQCLAAEDGSAQSAALISSGFSVDKASVSPGGTFKLTYTVKNSSSKYDIKNLTMRLAGGDVFTVANDVDTVYKDSIGKSQTAQFSKSFYCSASAASGMYPITVSATYDYDVDGVTEQGSAEFSYTVQVAAGTTTAQSDTPSVVSSFSLSKKEIAPGDSFTLNFKLANKSTAYDIKNVNIRLSGGDAFSIASDVDTLYKSKIAKNKSASFSKKFVCSKSAVSGMYPITAAITYEYYANGEKQQGTAECSFTVKVTKKASAKKGASLTPQIMVSSFSYGKKTITGGKNFTLTFTVKNLSSSIKAQNVIVKLSGGETFVVADGTDTLSVKSIAANSSVTLTKEFNCLTSATSGVYPITANVSYEYSDGGKQQGTNELTMSVPVVQPDKVQFQSIDLADKTVTVSEESDCAFSIVNTGTTKLSNGTVKLLDESGKELNSAFVGNIEAGSQFTSNYTLPVTFDETGVKKLTLVFEYENESMEKKSIEQEFKLTVEEYTDPFENVDNGESTDNEETASSKAPIIIGVCCGAAVLAAVIITIIVVKKKKHKKGKVEFDEEI